MAAVGASNLGRAQQFAEKFGFKHAFGSDKEVVSCPDVDVVSPSLFFLLSFFFFFFVDNEFIKIVFSSSLFFSFHFVKIIFFWKRFM